MAVQTGCYAHTLPHDGYIFVFTSHFFNHPIQNPEILRNLHIKNDLNGKEISNLTNNEWSQSAVNKALRKLNITKETTISHRAKYGEKTIKGKRVPYLSEQKIIDKMISMKNSASTYKEIVDYLNKNKIHSKYKMGL